MGQREEITAREDMLKRIRQALLIAKENPFDCENFTADIFKYEDDIPELIFAKNLRDNGGEFVYCENLDDFYDQFHVLANKKNWMRFRVGSEVIKRILKLNDESIVDPKQCVGNETSITQCEFLAARTGSIVISTAVCPDRLAWSSGNAHVVVATTNQVVNSLSKAYTLIKEKYKTLYPAITSVMSRKKSNMELFLFLIDSTSE